MAPLIRVIGSLNADMVSVTKNFPEPGETVQAESFTSSAGGKGANQAVACARLTRKKPASGSSATTADVDVQMVGAVGGRDLHFDGVLKPTLEGCGIDFSRVRVQKDDSTGVSVIIVTSGEGGENRICFFPGANFSGMPATPDVIKEGLAGPVPDVIVMQGEIPLDTMVGILRDVKVYRDAKKAEGKKGIEVGPEVIFNPAPAPRDGIAADAFAAVDHLIMNETEAEVLAPTAEQVQQVVPEAKDCESLERTARYYHKIGVSFFVVTLGSKGAWYSATDAGVSMGAEGVQRFTGQKPAAKTTKVIDTTAAGDTFVGGYATYMARWREQRRQKGRAGEDMSAEEKKERYQDVMEAALERGGKAAARCVERQGAMDSIPWEDEM